MKVYVLIEATLDGPMVLGTFPGTPAGYRQAQQVGDWECTIQETELDLKDLILDCCDGETRDDIISNLAKSFEMPELPELIEDDEPSLGEWKDHYNKGF